MKMQNTLRRDNQEDEKNNFLKHFLLVKNSKKETPVIINFRNKKKIYFGNGKLRNVSIPLNMDWMVLNIKVEGSFKLQNLYRDLSKQNMQVRGPTDVFCQENFNDL